MSTQPILTPEQVEFYQENGYLLVKGLFSREEAACYRQAGHELMARIYGESRRRRRLGHHQRDVRKSDQIAALSRRAIL